MPRFFNIRTAAGAPPPAFTESLTASSLRYDQAHQAEVYLTIIATSLVAIVGTIQTILQGDGPNKVRDQTLSGLVIGIPVVLGLGIAVCSKVAKDEDAHMKVLVHQGVALGYFSDNAAADGADAKATSERNILARLGLT